MLLRLSLLCVVLTSLPGSAAATGAVADAGTVVATTTPREVVPDGREPEIPRSEPPELVDDLSLGWTLARTMLVLAMVIGLAWLTLNVGLRKLLGIRPTVGTHVVTVLERVPLDQKRALFVVEAAGEVLLVGGGDGALALISKLDRAEVDRLRNSTGAPASVQLSPLVQKLLGRKDGAPPNS